MRKARREAETFSLSFLDIIACGFGAVILLLIMTLAFEPSTIREVVRNLETEAAQSRASRDSLNTERQALSRELQQKRDDLSRMQAQISSLSAEMDRADRQFGTVRASAETNVRIEEQLKNVQQSLTEEMRRLMGRPEERKPNLDAPIGGIPVDSEYIIFIIDTSGSMKIGAWPLVVRKVQEVLEAYPKVKGFQVMNDVGTYMFPTYAGQWIPDTPGRRSVVLSQLQNWNSFSRSNPAPGIIQAIRTFYRPDQPTSLFIFGDDFNGTSIDEVVNVVSQSNRRDAQGNVPIRIHTFGFPVLPVYTKQIENFTRFAHLMRTLAERNAGTFVGLNSVR